MTSEDGMKMNEDNLRSFWKAYGETGQDADYFATARVFEGVPKCWSEEVNYLEWRHKYARKLEVDPHSLTVVGSARLGYSIGPGKQFRSFGEDSDIDIAVVSPFHFDLAWSRLRDVINDFSSIPDPERNKKKGYIRKLVFDGAVDINEWLGELPFAKAWGTARDEMANELGSELRDREIGYRLYRDRGALRQYQLRSIKEAARVARSWMSEQKDLGV